MLFLDFDHVPDDALLTKAEVAVWRRTSIDTVESPDGWSRYKVSPRRVGITAGSVRALNRQQASDAVTRKPTTSASAVIAAMTLHTGHQPGKRPGAGARRNGGVGR
jgi:hypothetical protein